MVLREDGMIHDEKTVSVHYRDPFDGIAAKDRKITLMLNYGTGPVESRLTPRKLLQVVVSLTVHENGKAANPFRQRLSGW